MARSMKDALLKSGVIKQEDTQEARQAKERRERQQREQRIVDSSLELTSDALVTCSDCGERFDPTAPAHMAFGRADQCGPCARR
jgi:hypothetical protein